MTTTLTKKHAAAAKKAEQAVPAQEVEPAEQTAPEQAPAAQIAEQIVRYDERVDKKLRGDEKKGDTTRTDYDAAYEHDKAKKKLFKLRIVYNKKGCTKSGHCALSDIYDFELDQDFKGVLKEGKETAPGSDIWTKDVDTTEPHLAINAAKTCTPRVIAIIDRETGKRIAP